MRLGSATPAAYRLGSTVVSALRFGASLVWSVDPLAVNVEPPSAGPSVTEPGDILETDFGVWENATGGSYSVKWFRDDVEIPGETTSQYTVLSTDGGKTLKSEITYTNSAGAVSEFSNPVIVPVFLAPSITGVPTIFGDASVGNTLTAQAANTEANPSSATTWQWENNNVAIGGATASTYTLVAGDSGDDITVVQTETNTLGVDTAESAAVTVAAGDTTPPTVSGVSAGTQLNGNMPVTLQGLDEAGIAYWTLTTSNQGATANTNVKAGTVTDQVDSGSFAIGLGGGPYTEALTAGLSGTHYLQVVLEDAALNLSPVYQDGPITLDTAAATISGTSVTPGLNSGTLAWSVDETGTAYWRVTASDLDAATLISTGTSVTVSATGAQSSIEQTGLTSATKFQIVHVDAQGNTSAVTRVSFTPSLADWSITGGDGTLTINTQPTQPTAPTITGSDGLLTITG